MIQHLKELLFQSEGRLVTIVTASVLLGYLAGALTGVLAQRRRHPLARQLVRSLRLPVGCSIGLSGALWVAVKHIGAHDAALIVASALACCWGFTAVQIGAHLIHWLVRWVATPWKLRETHGIERGLFRDRDYLDARVGQEISRVREGSPRLVTVVAVGVRSGPRERRRRTEIWKNVEQAARCHDVVHRAGDGTVLAMLPDTSDGELRRWLAGIQDPDVVIGHAAFPVDGETAAALLDSAIARMWMEQGADPDEEPGLIDLSESSPCIPLGDEDLIFES